MTTTTASVTTTLAPTVDDLVLTGTADINGTGNARDNDITGNAGANVLDGGAGADVLVGGAGDDTLLGGTGNDTLVGGAGADQMAGGSGDDIYVVADAGDTVTEGADAGTDTVQSAISYTLTDNVENLALTGTAGNTATGNALDNALYGNAGANTLNGLEGDDILNGGTGADAMIGGSGDDTYVVDNAADVVTENAAEGIDTVESSVNYTLGGNVENLVLSGNANVNGSGNTLDNAITGNNASNVLYGLDGNDTLAGNGGNDTLDGGLGADTLQGGIGDDTYVVDQAGDIVAETLNAGTDTVQSGISYTLTDNVENLALTGTGNTDGTGNALNNIITGNAGSNTVAAGAGADTVSAGAGDDIVSGGDGNDALNGEAGDDQLSGDAGNDTLNGGLGADAMAGGTGDDIYVVDNDGDLVTEAGGAGTDLVQSSITDALTDNVENLTLTGSADINGTGNVLDNVINGNTGANVLDGQSGNDTINANAGNDTLVGGDGNDVLNGDAGDDQLQGDAGNDMLNGGLGADAMQGGTGGDTYIVDNAGDLVVEGQDEGIDSVQSSVNHTLTDNVENLTLTGAAHVNGTGNALDNVITGNTGNNVLNGLDGNDTLVANAGNDTLDGGSGADNMDGGLGNDTYVVDNAGDIVTEALAAGVDTVQSSIDYTLTANSDNLTLTGADNLSGTGNALNNIIIGNSGDNTISADAGTDIVNAGDGNDIVSGGDGVDTLNGEAGNDQLSGDAGNDIVNGGTGNDVAYGGDGNDAVNGDAGDDQLFGDAGNDTLNGGLDADAMAGGSGDDIYVVDNDGDVVTEAGGAGTDLVQSSITDVLTDNVENLNLTGSADINGTGNVLDNVMNGNTGANVLDGQAGDDTINANAGNDTLVGGDGNDILNGDAGDDQLQGDAGNDMLNGGIGADAMQGGTGDDTYIVDNAGDLVVESQDEGTDSVQSSVSHTLTGNVENLTLTGVANINGTGNALDNVINGNIGNNVLNGLDGNDTLVASSGNDTLDGGTGADNMQGGLGNDTYVVDNAGDIVTEALAAGTDTVQSSIDYTLTANSDNLTLTGANNLSGTGNGLNNVIIGNSGDNTISAEAGIDTVNAGDGNDVVSGGDGADTLNGEAGNDQLSGDAGNDIVNGGAGNDVASGGDGDDALNGDAGDDQLFGDAGNDTLNGGLDADAMAGGAGNDIYVVDNDGDVVTEAGGAGTDLVQSSITDVLTDNVENLTLTGTADINGTGNVLDNLINGNTGANVLDGQAGNDTINANAGNDTLVGGDGNDVLNGDAGDDQLQGDAGNDMLNGGTGADAMQGGTGDDSYIVEHAGDQVTESAGEGTDTVHASLNYNLTDNVENLTLTGSANTNGAGNVLDNVINGNNANNVLSGGDGNDTLVGNAGNDTLDGGAGADNMQGGIGNDTYVVDEAGDVVTEAAVAGTDTVQSEISYTLGANLENLTLTGSADLNGTGNAGANVIVGNAGANVIDGGAGIDSMGGGAGDDTYIVDNTSDAIVEAAGNGTDIAFSSANYVLSANVENLVLTGNAALNGTGNAQDNTITGNDANNVLSGMAGDDVIVAGAGNDTLDGGVGADLLEGGAGNDTYVVDNAGDAVVENAGGGTDTVQSSIGYTLTSTVENLTLTGTANIAGTGNALDNVITGNGGSNTLSGLEGNDTLTGGAGNDTLDGGAGADLLQGGAGDDTYVVDSSDTVVEAAASGTDTVQSGASYTLGANLENLVLTGSDNLNGTGNALNNTIAGTDGANVLDGGAGTDTLNGGAGDDTYIVDNSADVVVEAASGGTDTVNASASYVLSANVEHLVLTGTANISGTGNAGDNTITGNSGANTLAGGAGNDTLDGGLGADAMQGGTGDDTYIVDNSADTLVEAAGGGVDTALASATTTLGANVENLVLTGNAAINGTGNASDNTITGNDANNLLSGMAGNDAIVAGAGDDTLDGGVGADTLEGGTGNDTYVVDNAGDVVTENEGEGSDTVQASIDYTLASTVENLTLTGAANIAGTGNAQDNVITGNSGNNTLDGGAGADVLQGGAGNDTYLVDGSDTVVEAAGGGTDTVQSDASYTLGANLENLVLTGNGDLDGTGNALDNAILGTDGANVLDGGAGADKLEGGAGDDTYIVDNSGDVIVEAAAGGTDTVSASADYMLSANLENLVLTGTGNISGAGNAGDNTITGNSGANTLDGGLGADTLDGGAGSDTLAGGEGDDMLDGGLDADLMQGGAGNDTYIVDNSADTIVETAGGGVDTAMASASTTLGANVENLVLTGDANLEGVGNASDNTITGTSGDNLLSGMDGNDMLDGGAGNDLLLGGAGDDGYKFGLGAGADRIVDAQGSDTLYVGSGLTAADLEADRAGQDLVLRVPRSIDSVVLADWLSQSEGITRIVFDDGTEIDRAGIRALLNSAPTAVADDVSVGEDGGLAQVPVTHLLDNDTDPDQGDTLTVVAVGESALGATVSLSDGTIGYDIGNGYQQLAEGEVLEDSFTYTITDGMGETSSAVVNVHIVGANDAAVVADDSAAATEDTLTTLSGNVLDNDSDIDNGTVLQVASAGTVNGVYGSLTIAKDGSYTYTLNDGASVQALAEGQVVTERFEYVATDGIVGVASSLQITVTGTNDAPVVTADTAAITEDSAVAASGNVLANDDDADRATVLKVVAPGTYVGSHGTLIMGQDGSYTYSLDNSAANVQSLAEGQTVVDSFTYAATDGSAEVASTLDITITGTNDAPVVTADAASMTAGAGATASGNVLANDSDVDAGTVLTVATAGTLKGSYGELVLNKDGSYVYSVDAAKTRALGREANVVEHFLYVATDGISKVASTLDVTIAGANDAPVVATALADQSLTFNKAFSFQMPANSFTDSDQGDTLTYSASLADGSALPDWLKFNAETGTFSGTTPKQVGAIDVRVTATDMVAASGSTAGSLSASDVFSLSVSHGNEGVGNGEDAAPPGHDDNQNDGPGTSPGNPGSKGGKGVTLINAKFAIGGGAQEGSRAVDVKAEINIPLVVPTFVATSLLAKFSEPATVVDQARSSSTFSSWLAVDLAVSKGSPANKPQSWLDVSHGADTSGLSKATAGYLGSTSALGNIASALSAGSGTELNGFDGLGKGVKKIK